LRFLTAWCVAAGELAGAGDALAWPVPAGLEVGNAKVADGTAEGVDEGDEVPPGIGVGVGVGEGGMMFSQ
jgi:hypothetical protein